MDTIAILDILHKFDQEYNRCYGQQLKQDTSMCAKPFIKVNCNGKVHINIKIHKGHKRNPVEHIHLSTASTFCDNRACKSRQRVAIIPLFKAYFR